MNWQQGFLFIAVLSGAAAVILVLANPWLENREMLLYTLIPVSILAITGFLAAAL